jgi:hypothetical protein
MRPPEFARRRGGWCGRRSSGRRGSSTPGSARNLKRNKSGVVRIAHGHEAAGRARVRFRREGKRPPRPHPAKPPPRPAAKAPAVEAAPEGSPLYSSIVARGGRTPPRRASFAVRRPSASACASASATACASATASATVSATATSRCGNGERTVPAESQGAGVGSSAGDRTDRRKATSTTVAGRRAARATAASCNASNAASGHGKTSISFWSDRSHTQNMKRKYMFSRTKRKRQDGQARARQ